MRTTIAFFACLVLFANAAPLQQRTVANGMTISIERLEKESNGVDLCGTCASLTGQSLNILLNYILQVGVVGTCGKLCSNLKGKTEQTVCNIACDVVGLKEFVAALQKADLDPIYFCELVGVCKHDDNGAGSIDSITVAPASGAQGDTFQGNLQVTVTNHTGVGEFRFEVAGGVDQPSGGGSIYPELNPGSYGVKISIDTTPGDPSDPDAPQWTPGNYTLTGEFCMGECGSKHPHSKVFGVKKTEFNLHF